MRNAWLYEAQTGLNIDRTNINNLRYADVTTLSEEELKSRSEEAESEEEPKSLLMKVKEESEKVSLKLNSQKTEVMASSATSLTGKEVEKQWKE